jgi:hypothetical protein
MKHVFGTFYSKKSLLLVLANAGATANAISDKWNRSSTSGFFVISFSIESLVIFLSYGHANLLRTLHGDIALVGYVLSFMFK